MGISREKESKKKIGPCDNGGHAATKELSSSRLKRIGNTLKLAKVQHF